MFGGQVNPLISIIINNNNNNNDNNTNNNRLLLDLRMFYDDDADDYLPIQTKNSFYVVFLLT